MIPGAGSEQEAKPIQPFEPLLHGASRDRDYASGKRQFTRARARDNAGRERANVPKGTNEQESLLRRAEDNMRARQMTQLPGDIKQNASQNKPEEIPEGGNEKESLLGQTDNITRAGQMKLLPGEQEEESFHGRPPNFSLPKSPVLKPAPGRIF